MEPKSIASANSAIAAFTQISLYPSSPPMSSARGAPIPVYPLPPAAQRSVPRPSHLSPIYPAHFPSHLSPPPLYSSPLHYPFTDNTLTSSTVSYTHLVPQSDQLSLAPRLGRLSPAPRLDRLFPAPQSDQLILAPRWGRLFPAPRSGQLFPAPQSPRLGQLFPAPQSGPLSPRCV